MEIFRLRYHVSVQPITAESGFGRHGWRGIVGDTTEVPGMAAINARRNLDPPVSWLSALEMLLPLSDDFTSISIYVERKKGNTQVIILNVWGWTKQ